MVENTTRTIVCLSLSLSFAATAARAQITTRVSVQSDGSQCECDTGLPAISADGRYIAQVTFCPIAPNDTNGGFQDVYVHDRMTGATELVSVSSTGEVGDVGSATLYYPPSISADGRYVAFYSFSDNLVPNDLNGALDCFVHDRWLHTTSLISVSSVGVQGNGDSGAAFLSGDGRYVAYTSRAQNLVAGDSNGFADVFVFDRNTGMTTIESISDVNVQGDGDSYQPMLSFNGRYIVFESTADNLVPNDTNAAPDIIVRDRLLKRTFLASQSSTGEQGNNASTYPGISVDGRFVWFESTSSNLVPGDTNGMRDVFLRDIRSGKTELVSYGDQGQLGDDDSGPAWVSANGRKVAFHSFATNLVPNDTNGVSDVFVRDRVMDTLERVSVATDGTQGNLPSYLPQISNDGRLVAWDCDSTNIVPGDTNGWRDNFVHGPEFTLDVTPKNVPPGQSISLTVYSGVPGNPASLWVIEDGGTSLFLLVASGVLDADGNFAVSGVVPPGIGPRVVSFQGFCFGQLGDLSTTKPVPVAFQ